MTELNVIPQDVDEAYDKYYAEAERKGAIQTAKDDIELANKRITERDAFLRLEENPDFKLIVEKAYLTDTANENVRLLGKNLVPEVRADVQNILAGIGSLHTHFEGIMQMGIAAELELPRLQDDLIRLQS